MRLALILLVTMVVVAMLLDDSEGWRRRRRRRRRWIRLPRIRIPRIRLPRIRIRLRKILAAAIRIGRRCRIPCRIPKSAPCIACVGINIFRGKRGLEELDPSMKIPITDLADVMQKSLNEKSDKVEIENSIRLLDENKDEHMSLSELQQYATIEDDDDDDDFDDDLFDDDGDDDDDDVTDDETEEDTQVLTELKELENAMEDKDKK